METRFIAQSRIQGQCGRCTHYAGEPSKQIYKDQLDKAMLPNRSNPIHAEDEFPLHATFGTRGTSYPRA